VSRNYAVLRQRLQNHVPPCLPFVGTYLTDLTFVDVGNQTTRQLPGDGPEGGISVINFDKHMKTAKIISELQRFQIPYRLTEVPELQTWMQDQLVRVRSSDQSNVQNYYRRSLLLEPREQAVTVRPSPIELQHSNISAREVAKDKFDFLGWTSLSKKIHRSSGLTQYSTSLFTSLPYYFITASLFPGIIDKRFSVGAHMGLSCFSYLMRIRPSSW
jgi:hypothetical protein